MFADIEKTVQAHLLDLDSYRREEIYTKADQTVDQNNHLLETTEPLCRSLFKCIYIHLYGYLKGLATVYFSSAVRPLGRLIANAVGNVHGNILLKDHCFVAKVDVQH